METDSVKILLVVATRIEIAPFLKKANPVQVPGRNIMNCRMGGLEIDILITGIGVLNSVYWLSRELTFQSYDLVLNVGIAGTYNPGLEIGSVVHVTEEILSDPVMGEEGTLVDLFDQGLLDCNQVPFKEGILFNGSPPELPVLKSLPSVRGLTTNVLHTDPEIIHMMKSKYRVEVETMEGATVFYACILQKTAFIEIRSLSNQVGESSRQKWNIPLAVKTLNATAEELLMDLMK
jgi:futalosine hydrolase